MAQAVDKHQLRVDRDQLWAEAAHALNNGEQWWLTPEEQKISDIENKVFEAENPVAHSMAAWLKQQKVVPVSMTPYEVATQVLCYLPGQVTQPVLRNIARGLKQMGWERTKQRRDGQLHNAYRVLVAKPE